MALAAGLSAASLTPLRSTVTPISPRRGSFSRSEISASIALMTSPVGFCHGKREVAGELAVEVDEEPLGRCVEEHVLDRNHDVDPLRADALPACRVDVGEARLEVGDAVRRREIDEELLHAEGDVEELAEDEELVAFGRPLEDAVRPLGRARVVGLERRRDAVAEPGAEAELERQRRQRDLDRPEGRAVVADEVARLARHRDPVGDLHDVLVQLQRQRLPVVRTGTGCRPRAAVRTSWPRA